MMAETMLQSTRERSAPDRTDIRVGPFTIDPCTRTALISVAVFALIGHGFFFANLPLTHDALAYFVWTPAEDVHQLALGRYLQPLYVLIRGAVATPPLVGLLGLVWLALAVCLIVKLLGLRSRPLIVLTAGILTVNNTVTATCATYLFDVDVFALSLLLSVLAVWLCERHRYGFLLGAVAATASMALYQAYIQMTIALLLILICKRVLEGQSAAQAFRFGIEALIMLAAAGILYYCGLQAELALTGTALSHDYNGLASMGNYENVSIAELLLQTYLLPLRTLVRPTAFHATATTLVNLVLLATGAACTIWLCATRGIRRARLAILALAIALLPLGMDIVFFISKGMVHHLMVYSFNAIYLYVAMAVNLTQERDCQAPSNQRFLKACYAIAACGFAILLFNGVAFSGQVYAEKELVSEGTLSAMTRIEDRIEQLDGYVPGETPVVFIGSLNTSNAVAERFGFEQASGLVGNTYRVGLTYPATYENYFRYVLGVEIKLIDPGEYTAPAEALAMPSFPTAGCCQMVEGTVIVKLS